MSIQEQFNDAYKSRQDIAEAEVHSQSLPIERTRGADHHCHSTIDNEGIDKVARRKLLIASVLCLIFMIAEVVGGTIANSLAIMTDAAHLLSDFASFMISLFALYLTTRPATKRMSFGWHRAEVMGALVSVLFIWVVTGVLVYMAGLRVKSEEFEINADVMLITSAVGVIVNVIMACSLHQHSHGHGHNDVDDNPSNYYDIEGIDMTGNAPLLATDSISELVTEVRVKAKDVPKTTNRTNINVRAAFVHVIGDLIQSVGVLIAANLIFFKPEWKVADPICTFIFSILVLFTTLNILRDTMNVLMEGAPKGLDFDEVKDTLLRIDGVCLVHNLRIWSLTMNKTALSAHLAVDSSKNMQIILKEATRTLMVKYRISDATIQVEYYVADMNNCTQCLSPNS